MSLQEILLGSSGGIFLLMTFVQISPIKLNPWSYIARAIGHAINKDVIDKVEVIDKKVVDLERKMDERNATLCRTHILRFNDEIMHGTVHSYEHYQQILIDIDAYETYCKEHPEYRNNVAGQTIKYIKKKYQENLDENNFL